MTELNTHSSKEKRYLSIRSTVEVLFVIGLILEFMFRRDILPIEYRAYALAPFIINIILICVGAKYLHDIRDSDGHKKRVSNIALKIFLNLAFITLMLFSLNKV